MNLKEPEVLAVGMLTMALCLVLHAVFMFLVFRAQRRAVAIKETPWRSLPS